MSFNKAIIIGRLTATPELKTTNSNKFVCSFTVAVDRRFNREQADFINCTAWEKSAEFVSKHFTKGSEIGVDGEIQTRNYEDKNGNRRTATEIRAEHVFFVGGKTTAEQSESASQDGYNSTSAQNFEEVTSENDLPF